MDPNQVIAELVQSHDGICVLDKIHLPYDHADAGPAAKFGLGVELYLPDIDRNELRERVLQFSADYCRTFENKVGRFLPDGAQRTVKFTGDPTPQIRADFERISVAEGYGATLLGEVELGLPNDNIAPYQADIFVNYPDYRELSFVRASFTACDESGLPNFKIMPAAVLRWCTICQPVHGCGGFTYLFAPAMQQNSVYTLQMMKRYPGFDFQDGGGFLTEAEAVHNRIKCVNWLTVLCDALVDELGGLNDMRDALEPMCKVHEYPGGVVIQAGAYPQLGDTYRDDIPEAYRLVARHTKPIRFEGYSDSFFRVPDELDDIEEALAWVRRFD